jgi:uncharacterized protein (TIRG00374 family)
MRWHHLLRPTTLYLLLAALLLWFTVRQVELAAIGQVLGQLQYSELAVLGLLNALILGTIVLRWSLLLLAQGYPIAFWTLLRYRLAAFGVTYFTPGPQFGGEPLQVYFVKEHHGVPLQQAIAAVTMDKVVEMLVNFGFLVGGVLLLLDQGLLARQWGYGSLFLALLLLALPLLLLLAYLRGQQPAGAFLTGLLRRFDQTDRRPAPQWLRRSATLVAESETHAAHLCQQQPLLVLWALTITLTGWGLMLVEFGYAAQALGVPLSASQVIMVLLAARVAFLLPMPAGIGTLETSLVLAFHWLNFDPAAGLALSLLIRGRDVLLGGLGLWLGGLAFWHRGLISGQQAGARRPADSEAPI